MVALTITDENHGPFAPLTHRDNSPLNSLHLARGCRGNSGSFAARASHKKKVRQVSCVTLEILATLLTYLADSVRNILAVRVQ